MTNPVSIATRAIKKADVDIRKLGKETAKIIHDLNSIQKSANSLTGRLHKDISATAKEILETMGSISLRKSRNNTSRYLKLCSLYEQISNVPEDLTRALRSLRYANEHLIKK